MYHVANVVGYSHSDESPLLNLSSDSARVAVATNVSPHVNFE
jgi:hypothetical protein